MKTLKLFENIDATQDMDSASLDVEKRMEWMLSCRAVGTDLVERIIIEYSVDPAGQIWDALINPATCTKYFLFDENGELAVKDDRLQGKFFRIRLDSNGNTGGTVSATLGYNDYP